MPNENDPRPLIQWVLLRHPETPKGRAKQWIEAGRVTVAGVVVRKPHERMPDPGDTLQLGTRRASTLDCSTGWRIHPRVTLLHLDASLAVVNKGPGIIAVDAPGTELTVQSVVADYLSGRLHTRDSRHASINLPTAYRKLRPLPVHRLDQYTSGVFCLATNPEAREHLIEQLKARTMKREYVAYVEGAPAASRGVWRQWLQSAGDGLRQTVVPEGVAKAEGSEAQEAVTHYEIVSEYPLAGGRGVITKLRLRLESGRKHQIRVQAAYAGMPLVGDRAYHPGLRGIAPEPALVDFPRQALHAEILALEHPAQPGSRLTWTAQLPPDLQDLEAALQTGNTALPDRAPRRRG